MILRLTSMLVGYLLGCFQTAYIIGKLAMKTDIREMGSKNAGTTNAVRVFGWKFGFLTFLGDISKAVAAVLVMSALYQDPKAGLYAGLGVVLGHNWPVFLKFKGGKGIASTVGALLALDYRIGLGAILFMILVVAVTRYVSLASILMALSIPAAFAWLGHDREVVAVGVAFAALAIYRHRENIARLLQGRENKLGKKKEGKP
ncbi:glycerol-3-phosphate 1-O-acyltransferase PlsY [Anaerotalea alkaliphila]|uniref:Glycerol-3-phosphate acyltransferase n=1 Tax=Anaerotalea alkaliphila TaxID=2662126 RepID=A0A7X5KLV3_9FIRM|nr:glycerol-3-phosphate 1-O-acyltransferase PlsY [Anaerotalea alkaliphila]NDL66314.1 glycerol-3-phosphate 1-O-acyltransferase PlsY [Anaerotalea alkaliphila]